MRRNGGFTLIELLVVIAIIAILAAILFPVFAKARETARRAACLDCLSQCGRAFQMYLSDNTETYPASHEVTYGDYPVGYSHFWIRWAEPPAAPPSKWQSTGPIYRYLKNGAVTYCPADKTYQNDSWVYSRKTSYAYPYSYYYKDPFKGNFGGRKTVHRSGEVTHPTRHILLMELYVFHNPDYYGLNYGIYMNSKKWEGNILANDGHVVYKLWGKLALDNMPYSRDPLSTRMSDICW